MQKDFRECVNMKKKELDDTRNCYFFNNITNS